MNELTQQGIAALKAGDRAGARRLLAAAIDQDETDATAWLWLAATLNNDADRVTCLRQVLKLQPENQAAKRGLAEILNRQTPARPAEPAKAEPLPVKQPPATQPAEVSQAAPVQETAATPVASASAEQSSVDQPAVAPATAEQSSVVAPAPESAWDELNFLRNRARRRARAQDEAPEQVIFKARPSQVPALLCFWLFLIGAGGVGALLGKLPGMEEPIPLVPGVPAISLTLNTLVGFGLGLLLELVVFYVIIRNFVARYQLTDRQLTARFRGRRLRLDLSDLNSVECHQSFFQKMNGTGDIDLEAVVDGQLAFLRLRNITDCVKHAGQIQGVIRK